ncbi:MAG: hypothetical protein M0R41_17220 [Methylobacter tundripaludum]|uniref:Lipoprotein n=1 Tax=Methylobacter tundripaludum TaxID=173365 RepID=A0A2S6H058_9GAMM|nr:hypothetical protein [Methylobacter tundripaludum]MCK9638013.1 hypothetical protein [Methylobacter tundripaludum]PPK70811.1 hypothetical protein B0F88_108166 [Methylobacter tundripaludum]
MKLVYLAGALFLAGCASTPTTQISAFGNSASAIAGKIDSVIDEYNNAALDRKFTDYAATYNGDKSSLLTSDELGKIDKPIGPEQKKNFAIYKANRALGSYSKALSDLASAGSRVDIDLAAANLYGSISSLNDQYKTIKETDKDLFDTSKLASFSTLIAAIGSSIVEEKRREAIKGIVTEADPKVSLICDVIIEQLKLAGIEDAIATSRQYILSEELIDYKSRVKTAMPLDERRTEIKRLYSLQQGVSNSKLLIQQTQKAVAAVKESHATLANELKEGRFTSAAITSTIGRLKDLEKNYGDFEALLLSCKKIAKNDKGILSCEDK